MSEFDKDTFLNMEVQGANETNWTPLPEGEYTGFIDEVDVQQVQTKNGEQPVLTVIYNITDDKAKEFMDQDKVTVRDSVFLDLDDGGNLLFGKNKNVKLGKIREACKQNDPKKPWGFRNLQGAGPLKLKLSQRTRESDGAIFPNVDRVVAA